MNGVTTAILLFIFAALAFPRLVKNRPQFYMALAAVLVVIFLDALAYVIDSKEPGAFTAFTHAAGGFFQIVAVLLIVMSAGGLRPGELAEELTGAIEVLRRGEATKETIIPLSAAALKKKSEDAAAPRRRTRAEDEDRPRETFNLDDPPPAAPAARKPDSGPLPLE